MPKYKFKRQDKRIEETECAYLINSMPSFQLKAIIATLYVTGARISEILALTPRDIRVNRKEKLIEINIISLKRKEKEEKPFPTARPLSFNKDTPFIKLLTNYVKDHKTQDKLFYISREMVWYHIKKASESCSPHIFRHSRLQKLADLGATAHQIRMFAGHKKLGSSISYIESSKHALKDLARLIK